MKFVRSQKGFTLIEAMLSVVLGTTAIVSVALMLDNGIFLAKDNRSRIFAEQAIRAELAALRNSNVTSFSSLASSMSFSSKATTEINKLSSGTGTITVVSTHTDLKKVTILISWTARNGSSMSQSFTTYICRKGINGS